MKNSIVTIYDQSQLAVTLTEAKTRLKIVDRTDFDTDVTRLIKVATQWLERRYGISILNQTREQRQDNFDFRRVFDYRPTDTYSSVTLLYPPVQSITSVIYTDSSGTPVTLVSGTDYSSAGLMTSTVGAQDILKACVYPINSWPAVKNIPEAVKITYVSGFGADNTKIPENIRESILRLVVFMFENPMDEVTGETVGRFEMGVSSFMSTYEQFGYIYDESQRLDYAR